MLRVAVALRHTAEHYFWMYFELLIYSSKQDMVPNAAQLLLKVGSINVDSM
jgi:hypothetical protein